MQTLELRPLYAEYLQEARWEAYVSSLSRDGLDWRLSMDMATLAAHLKPLQGLPKDFDVPDRISILSAACRMDGPLGNIDRLFEKFLVREDHDAAVAAAVTAIYIILNSGRDFQRFESWDDRITELLKTPDGLSPLALAAATGGRGFIQTIYFGDYIEAAGLLRKAIFQADAARSISLKLWYSIHICFCYLSMGDLAMLDIVLFDIAPFMEMDEVPFFVKAHYNSTSAFIRCLRGDVSQGKRMQLDIVEHPLFNTIPGGYAMFFLARLLEAAVLDEDKPLIETCLKRIQSIAIPKGDQHNHAYLHFNLSLIYFVLGDVHRAKRHIEETKEREKLVQTTSGRYRMELLYGQIMSELSNGNETDAYFAPRVPVWTRKGYQLFASTACFELSCIHLRHGRVDAARGLFEKGVQVLPSPEDVLVMHRPSRFFGVLKRALFPDVKQPLVECEFTPGRVRIETFGSLRLHINGRTVFDRQWKGKRTRLLLKALIVFGAGRVPMDLLTDLLWPDAEGDAAVNSLRVTLSRLRRVGQSKSEPTVDWIKVKQGKVSLAAPLCHVDVVQFQQCLPEAMKKADTDLLRDTLSLYQDDFLKDDITESWIIQRREQLRVAFVKGVLFLAGRNDSTDWSAQTLTFIEKAIEKEPCNEDLHAALMRVHLRSGDGAKAAQVFRRAERLLRERIGMAPGPSLAALFQEAGRHRLN